MRSINKPWLALALASAISAIALWFALNSGFIRDGSHFSWYAARATGIVAYLLASAAVFFGLATSTHLGQRMLGKANVADLHRVLSLLTLFAVGTHTLLLALDQYATFGPSDLLVPFITWYRPVWTGLGILAAYLAVALYFSFYIRSLIGYKAWRTFHYAAFAIFALGTLHGLFAGTDTGAPWAIAIYISAVASVVLMFAYRIVSRDTQAAFPKRNQAVSANSTAGTRDVLTDLPQARAKDLAIEAYTRVSPP